MLLIFIISISILLLLLGFGIVICEKFNLYKIGIRFASPVGVLSFIGIMQIFIYPLQWFEISAIYSHLIILVLLLAVLLINIFHFKIIKNRLIKCKEYKFQILLGLLIFLAYCYLYQFIEFKFRTDDVNFYSPFVYGQVFGTLGSRQLMMYTFQGLMNFQAFLEFIYLKLNFLPYYESIMPLGLLSWQSAIIFYFIMAYTFIDIYNVIFINYISKFNIKKLYFNIIYCISMIFTFSQFWYLSHPYYGNTFRRLTVIYLIYFILSYLKKRNIKIILMIMIFLFSLIAQTSTGFFLGFMIVYSLLMIVMLNKKKDYIVDFTIISVPLAIYSMIIKPEMIKYVMLIYLFAITIIIIKKTSLIESLLNKFSRIIIFILPILFSIIPLLPSYRQGYGVDSFFSEHSFDMVYPLLVFNFDKTHFLLSIFNIMIWYSIILFVFKKKNKTEMLSYLSLYVGIILLTFFNPFVCKFISENITQIVYFRIYDLFFNPFTLTCYLAFIIISTHDKHKTVIIIIISVVTISQLTYSHLSTHLSDNVNPVYHKNNSEINVLKKLRETAYFEDYNKTVIVASQIAATSLLADFEIENVVNNRIDDIHGLYNHKDDESVFTQIFYRKLYDDPRLPTDFNRACELAKDRNVEFVIIDRQYNYQMEDGLGYCGEVMFDLDNYRVYQMRYDWLD